MRQWRGGSSVGKAERLFRVIALLGHFGDESAGKHIFGLSWCKSVPHSKRRLLGRIADLQGVRPRHGVAKFGGAQHVALVDRLVVVGIFELDWQNPEVGEIVPMNAGERFGDNQPRRQVVAAANIFPMPSPTIPPVLKPLGRVG